MFHLRQPMALYLTDNTICQGLFFTYEWFILSSARLSDKDLGQGYVRERLKLSLREFCDRYSFGIISNNMKYPSPKCYMSFWGMTTYSDTLHFTNSWHNYRTLPYNRHWPHYQIPWCFYRSFVTGSASQQRSLTLLDTWSCPIWDLHLFHCLDKSLVNLSCLRTFNFKHPRYFYFAINYIQNDIHPKK